MKIIPQPIEMMQTAKIGETGRQTPAEKDFADVLMEAVNEVNTLQNESAVMKQQLVAGQIEDVHKVTIAAEKASTAFQLTMQIRNKVVEAYQEIMRMQV